MALVWFPEDIAHILRGAGESVSLFVTKHGLQRATEAAYVDGYLAALRTVAISLGLPTLELPSPMVIDVTFTASGEACGHG